MKKFICCLIYLMIFMTSFQIVTVVAEAEYISVPIDISSNFNTRAYTDFGDSFTVAWNTIAASYYVAIGINSFKANSTVTWKNTWQTDGSGNYLDANNTNTLAWKDIEYNMVLNPSDLGYGALGTGGSTNRSFNVTPNYYEKINLLSNGYTGLGYSGNTTSTLGIGVVLTYADGTQEYVVSKPVYYATSNTIESASYWNGFTVPNIGLDLTSGAAANGTYKARNVLHASLTYINPYEIAVNSNKQLTGINILGSNSAVTITNGTATYSTVNGTHSGASIYAMSVIIKRGELVTKYKNQINNIINIYSGQNINTNSNFYSEISNILNIAQSYGIKSSELLDGYLPEVRNLSIKGKYTENETLMADYSLYDAFGLDLEKTNLQWYKSPIITEGKTSDWIFLGSDDSYMLKKDDIGYYIYVTAEPECESCNISDISSKGNLAVSSAFFKIVAPEAKNVYFKAKREIESARVGEAINVHYIYKDVNGDKENGTVFTFEKSDSANGDYINVYSGTNGNYVITDADMDSYIRCSVKVKNIDEKGDEAETVFSENLIYVQNESIAYGTKIIGTYGANKTLLVLSDDIIPVGYTDCSEYQWYMTDDFSVLFPESWTKTGTNSQLYKIESVNSEKYFVLLIKSKCTDQNGNTIARDDVIKYFYKAAPPIAYNLSINSTNADIKSTKNGDILSLSYYYKDPNGDDESGTEIVWEKSSDEINWETIQSGGLTYVISEMDDGYIIHVKIIPKNGSLFGDGAEASYSNSFAAPCAPVVSNATVSGAALVGKTVTALYDFYDANGNADVGSKVNWYKISSNGEKNILSTGINYIITSADAGHSIMYDITPVTNVIPCEGNTVSSEAVTISSATGGTSGGSPSKSSVSSTSTAMGAVEVEYFKNEPEAIFLDIKNHWAKDEITYLAERGYVKGKVDGFYPEDSVTRAEFSAMIARIMSLVGTYKEGYSDVSSDAWYSGYVQALSDAKIISGSDNRFMPELNITREHLAKIIVEAYKYKKNINNLTKADISSFGDSKEIDSWATDYIANAVKLGLMNGRSNDCFEPLGEVTRAEAAVVLKRLIDLL